MFAQFIHVTFRHCQAAATATLCTHHRDHHHLCIRHCLHTSKHYKERWIL